MDITHVTIEYEGGVVGQISDSWIHPVKRVNMLVRGTKATAIFDDTLPTNKLVIIDHTTPGAAKPEPLDFIEIEPLKLECQHFLNCFKTGTKPRSDGLNGYQVVSILEEAEKIMLGERRARLDKVNFKSSRSKKKYWRKNGKFNFTFQSNSCILSTFNARLSKPKPYFLLGCSRFDTCRNYSRRT